MRTLRSLIEEHDPVWLYCGTKELQEQFLQQAEAEGFLGLDGHKPSDLSLHHLYGIHNDLTIGHLSYMMWCIAFCEGPDAHFKVDYGSYIAGKDDYICHEAHFTPVDLSVWDQIPDQDKP